MVQCRLALIGKVNGVAVTAITNGTDVQVPMTKYCLAATLSGNNGVGSGLETVGCLIIEQL